LPTTSRVFAYSPYGVWPPFTAVGNVFTNSVAGFRQLSRNVGPGTIEHLKFTGLIVGNRYEKVDEKFGCKYL